MKTKNYIGNSTKTGVYVIKNNVNNKVYVGSTKSSFHSRKTKHLTALRCGSHFNRHLQAAWDKYGEGSFVFEIMVMCPSSECEWYESVLIKKYQSYLRAHGYNIADTVGYRIGYTLSVKSNAIKSAHKKNIAHTKDGLTNRERGLNKKILMYTIDGELILEAPSGKWLSDYTGWGRPRISNILSNRRLVINNHIIIFANDHLTRDDISRAKCMVQRRLVNIFNMNGDLIYSKKLVKEAAEILNCKDAEIRMCCLGYRARIGKFITKYI